MAITGNNAKEKEMKEKCPKDIMKTAFNNKYSKVKQKMKSLVKTIFLKLKRLRRFKLYVFSIYLSLKDSCVLLKIGFIKYFMMLRYPVIISAEAVIPGIILLSLGLSPK